MFGGIKIIVAVIKEHQGFKASWFQKSLKSYFSIILFLAYGLKTSVGFLRKCWNDWTIYFFPVDANNHIGVKLYYYHKIEAIS